MDQIYQFSIGEQRFGLFEGPLIHRRFEANAASPTLRNAPCLANATSRMNFAEVDHEATVLAKRLAARGVARDKAVAILLDRSFDVVIAILATLKAGGCYVPLDPSFPAERLAGYLEDSAAVCVITQPSHAQEAAKIASSVPVEEPVVLLVHDQQDESSCANTTLPPPEDDDDEALFYCMFTSGSTGRPKGVQITHRGVRDLIGFFVEKMKLTAADVFCLNTTVSFDSYVLYLYSSLAVGGCLVVPDPEAHLDPEHMADLVAYHGISILEVVPSLAAEYLNAFAAASAAEKTPRLIRFLTGGEALTPSLAERIYAAIPTLASGGLFNTYGPTEVTCQVFTGPCTPPFQRIPLGRPDFNLHAYVVRPQDGELCGVQEPGELWLSGPRLARGYSGREDLTAAAFVDNPFFAVAVAAAELPQHLQQYYRKCYRTGDLVQWGEDGELEFLGRIDHQVKINGVRMELSEIEAALASAPGVHTAAVKAWKMESSEYRLAGYVAPANVDPTAVLAHCASLLLPSMVPATVMVKERLQHLPSGKLDLKSLPEPQWATPYAKGDQPVVLPNTETERLLISIWSKTLGLEESSVGVEDNFFELGGTSLKAGIISSATRRATGFELPGVLIYQTRSVRSMASALDKMISDSSGSSSHLSRSSGDSSIGRFSSPRRGLKIPPSDSSDGSSDDLQVKSSAVGFQLPLWLVTFFNFFCLAFAHIGSYINLMAPTLVTLFLYRWTAANVKHIAPVLTLGVMVSHILLLLFSIAAKWVLLGRLRPSTAPLWGRKYLAWWTVRALMRHVQRSVLPFVKSTKLHIWYLRAMGAKIGRDVVIDTVCVTDFDLVEIGDGTVIAHDALIVASEIIAGTGPNDRGSMVFNHTRIGKNCTIGNMSFVGPGADLPDGTVVSPSSCASNGKKQRADVSAGDLRIKEGHFPLVLDLLSYLILLISYSCLRLLEVGPPFWLWFQLNKPKTWRAIVRQVYSCAVGNPFTNDCFTLWWTDLVGLSLLPFTMVVGGLVYMWLLIPVKYLLVQRLTPEKCKKQGLWWRWRLHLWRAYMELPYIQAVYSWAATEVFNGWLRGLGAQVGSQAWLSENFRCSEADMVSIGDYVSICSSVTMIPATINQAAPIKLEAGCDCTNQSTVANGVVVNSGAVLGVYTYAKTGQEFAPNSITLNEFVLHPGDDMESGKDAEDTAASVASRAVTNWQYVRYNLIYCTATVLQVAFANAMLFMPLIFCVVTALYFGGIWFSFAILPVSVAVQITFTLSFAVISKLILLPRAQGEHPIFLSARSRTWQLMCITAHLFDDMYELMGSQFYVWYARLLGAKIGSGVCCLGGYNTELDRISMGDGAVINERAFFLAHTVEYRKVKFGSIDIKARATVGCAATLLPNTVIEDGARLGNISVLMKGEVVPKDSYWSGIPAVPAFKYV